MEVEKIPKILFNPAYSGGLLHMDKTAWPLPTVFDVEGLEEKPQEIPIIRDHDQGRKVGQTETVDYSEGQIRAVGAAINYGIDPDAKSVIELARRGAKLQASVGTGFITPQDIEFIDAGQTGCANGREFSGPCEIVRKWRLKEISIVTLGADDDGTAVQIAEAARPQEATATGGAFFAPRVASETRGGGKMKKSIDWGALLRGLGVKAGAARTAAAKIGAAADPTTDEIMQAIEDAAKEEEATAKRGRAADGEEEQAREELDAALMEFAAAAGIDLEELDEKGRELLKALFERYGTAADGEEEKEAQAADGPDDEKTACANSGGGATPRTGRPAWSRTKYPVEYLGQTTGGALRTSGRPDAARVAEASLLTCNGAAPATLARLGYSEREIDEAQRVENRNLSILGLMYRTGAASPGCADVATIAEAMRDANFKARAASLLPGYRVGQAAGYLSTVDIPNVLANVMHKSLLNGLYMVDDPSDKLARVVNARDFRPQSFVSLLASGEFEDVKANGELANLKLSDTGYTNSAKMRGFELRLGYEAIANDDMNALQEIPKIMGRKAGLRKQKIFFENLVSAADIPGVSGNPALTLAGLDKAFAAFRGLKDGDGDPLGLTPAILLVSPDLEQTALNLVNAREIVTGATGTPTGLAIVPNVNRYAGRLEVVTSPYLGTSGPFSSAWSDKRWMLLANANDLPLVILSYYQNRREPTLNTRYGEIEVEGVKFSCYWGFGVSTADKNAAVNSNPS